MDLAKDIDVDKSEAIRDSWNQFSELYESFAENNTIQSSVMLYSLTLAKKADRVCEVGVGCGFAARMFVFQIMKPQAVYFASDISDEMTRIFARKFKLSFGLDDAEALVAKNEKVGITLVESTESFDADKLVDDMGEVQKKVFITRLNNEVLPYPDNYFDVYISNLSLMIVSNHHNQLAEAYRVVRQGGMAAFSVWGRKENSEFFTLIPQAMVKSGLKPPAPEGKSPFHLSNKDDLEKDVRAAGFSEVKIFYSPTNVMVEKSDDLYDFYHNSHSMKQLFSSLTQEQDDKLREEFTKIFDEKFGPASTSPVTWEVLICIAKK